ncbi:MAG: AraC family transcriptional regulator [Thermoanaerobaculia bacterium]|nr:AraC family transcriptional regulator [Thermoanaerobaculia bacterium]
MRQPSFTSQKFTMHWGWRILLKDLGINPSRVLRRAALPEDLLHRQGATLNTRSYFGFWRALYEEADDPLLPLRLGQTVSVESFDAPIFAAMCSPDFNTTARRISRFKPLLGPVALHVDQRPETTTLDIERLDKTETPPLPLAATELVFFVQLARLATWERIRPEAVTTPRPPQPAAAYTDYFGCRVETGASHGVTFSAHDAARPFLTENESMWQFFLPELRKRLSELDASATMGDRVRAALLELLPSGETSLGAVSRKLAVSTRTLQRRLQTEEASFQQILDRTREELARHYLTRSELSGSEISLLLGFEEPSSFFRAFQGWTGETPQRVREGALLQ